MKPIRTLVVVANEREARILDNRGVGKGLSELHHFGASEFGAGETAHSDAPGRSRGAPGQARHGFEPPTSDRRLARDAFARHVIERINACWAGGAYSRLILCAPPKTLGELRAELGDLAAHLQADLDKDLVQVPLADLPARFAGVAAF